MATHCSNFAAKLGLDHITSKILWGQPGFPPRPTESFERDARNARYDLLYKAMLSSGSNTLALGHHLDDQVETSLMRLGKGSTLLGARGMRPIRRWGMSEVPKWDFGQRDLQGMRMWMIRPLLQVGKDRILATCEANGLEYVTDKTNFQPDITIRNAIRHTLENNGDTSAVLEKRIKEQLHEIDEALSKNHELGLNLSSGLERARGAVLRISSLSGSIHAKVDKLIEQSCRPSPPGTLLLSPSALQSETIDLLARKALVERVLRYVSPEPWGSLRAQSHSRSSQVDRIVNILWGPMNRNMAPFTAGSGVVWTPVNLDSSGDIKPRTGTGTDLYWLAHRQPPPVKNKGLHEDAKFSYSGQVDLTDLLATSHRLWQKGDGAELLEVLWDRRFRIRLKLSAIPRRIIKAMEATDSRVVLCPQRKWHLPQLSLQTQDSTSVLHTAIDDSQDVAKEFDGWISIDYVRTLASV
ncbi:tRNA(Ile)-lysidine synthetase [Coprinopsis cinerea okayama7|uniref:tRNA(Ile)-lysidine synthetase n=1 Tax=Coprinopsis cinerea (strain Okayama-7 / 130 / ATCC MYA-4618 / FGSC 9003) TaxID=240176 RepID=A8NEN0_COPC7|nr:tRNA(Ile)-lysidine synthetase [Coprinopsis cinerea okayama7\|eukprot:XP_001833078.2 tRNA(Ile)-lysidine synthetase [Coprinopsis cinerea okayama7\